MDFSLGKARYIVHDPLGFIVNNIATDFSGNVYIIDLETGKKFQVYKVL